MSLHKEAVVQGIIISIAVDWPPSNGLRFSCRRGALHHTSSKKQRSCAPKGVSCKRLLGRNLGSDVPSIRTFYD